MSDKEKDLTKYEEGCPKEGGIYFGSPGTPPDKIAEAMSSMFDPEQDHKDGTPYEFTHVTMGEVIKKSQPGIIFNWGAKGVGFGQIIIVSNDGKLYIDDECMSKEFIKEMFGHFIDEYYKEERRKV